MWGLNSRPEEQELNAPLSQPAASHVNFDCLDNMVSARFLHHKVIIFPFVINNYFEGR